MKYQFETMDDEVFVLDVKTMQWGRSSKLLARELEEEGSMVPLGGGRYSLDGRTSQPEGAEAGLTTVQIILVAYEDLFVVYLVPNVRVKEDTFKMGMPEEAQKFIRYAVRNPSFDCECP